MTVCLYKCLTAAGLQRHYARFTVMGIYRAAHLSTLRMDDYPNLGVCSMEDRARLYQLVQLVKSRDPRSLTYDDIGIYNESEYEGSDEIFPANNNSFSHYGNPDGVVRRDKNESGAFTVISNASHYRPKYARRRLDFSAENTNQRFCSQFEDPIHVYASHSRKDVPVHANGSATPIQLGRESRSTVECDLRQNSSLNERSCSCDPHNGDSIKLHITRGSSVFNSHIRLVPKNETFGKLNTSSAAVTSETFTNNPSAQKDRKSISSRKNGSIHVTKPIPTYEAKRTAGYNYGLPLSSPQDSNRQVEGPRINVCVRKRPLTRAECRRGEADVVTTPSGECVVVHESKEAVDLTEYILQHRFHFDQVFGEESTNEEVYQKTAYPLVQHVLRGGKATCFAYGQTGAGKTYTMLGSSHGTTGLYALAVQDIFTHLSATSASQRVYVSFFEIYCGHLYDLLEHRKRLFAREDGKKVVHISGLRDVRVDSVSSLLEVISQGTAERTQGMSGVNPLSSRSHALLQIQLRDLNQKMTGRMWFVDLAGSERASDANEPNKRSRLEGAEINQSLLALKECIRSLDKEESHTPFRQSKLTQVLKDSFVGDSMTCMIANISPGHSATEHTLNTLRYADRVKELRGQNGIIGRRRRRRRSNVAPSDKNYMSGSNKRNRRNVGTTNPKLENKNKIFCPKTHTRPHIWDNVLCSTPKKTTCGEKTQSRSREDILLEHISPIRGLAQSEGRCLCKESEVRQDGVIENEQCSDIHSHCVKVKDTKAVEKMGQQSNGSVNGCDLTFSKRESGFYLREQENHQQTITGRRREELEWTEVRRKVKSCRETCGKEEGLNEREVYNGDNKEKVRHLRQYHQQLQQFLPSPTSSFVHPLSSSTCPPFSSSVQGSLLHSSHFLRSTLTDPCLVETSNGQTETSSNKPDNVAEGDECASEGKGMAEAAGKAAVRKEEMTLAERKAGEIRCCWVGSTEMKSQHIPTNTEEHLSGCYDSEDKRLQTRDIACSLEQGVSDYYSRNPQFHSPQLQAVAERPLSPVCEDTSQMSVLLQDNLSRDFSSGIMNPLPISQLDVLQQAPTASFLQAGNSDASICSFNSESAKGESWETDNMDDLAEDEHDEFFLSPLELPYSKILQINMSAESDTATTTVQHKQQKCIISSVSGRVGNKRSSIKVHHNHKKKELTLEKNVTASITKPQASSLIHSTDDFGSCSSHNTSECVHNTDSKSIPNINKQQLKPQSGCLKSAQPNHCNSSKIAPELFSPADLGGEKSSNQQIKPTIHLFNIDGFDYARLCIIEAHLEQLKEMETICHKEGELLCQQHDMAFVEFVHKLAEILERKARCVRNMRAQLMAYLNTNHSTQENCENAIM